MARAPTETAASGRPAVRAWLRGTSLLAGFCLALAALPGCAGQPAPDRLTEAAGVAGAPDTGSLGPRAAYEYHVLAGELAIQRGKTDIAAREYVAALDYAHDAAVAERATRIAIYAGNPALAYRAAGAWASAAPDAIAAQRAATRLALGEGDAKSLAVYARALVAAAGSVDAGYRLLADLLSGQPAHAQLAVDTMRRLADDHAHTASAQYALGVVAMRYQRTALAGQAAKRALRIDPERTDAALLQAAVAIRNHDARRARALIADLPGDKASRARYHLTLARLLVNADENDAALEEFARALELAPDNVDAKYSLAILALQSGDADRAERLLQQLYGAGQRRSAAAFYLGVIHERKDDYAGAQRWYERVEDGSHAVDAKVRSARMRFRQGDLAGARARLQALRASQPDLADQLYAAEAQLLLDAKRPQAALGVYNDALAQFAGNPDLLYGRSIIFERLGERDRSKADLRAILAKDPDNAPALNALGYMLANHSSDYDKALDYIQRALQADPDNPAILDSMGWVLYRRGQLTQARSYLERAHEAFPDPEVAAHLGEVLWQQGNRKQARRIWQDSLSDNPASEVLKKTMARLDPDAS